MSLDEDLLAKFGAPLSGLTLAFVPAWLLSVGEKVLLAFLLAIVHFIGVKVATWLWDKWKSRH